MFKLLKTKRQPSSISCHDNPKQIFDLLQLSKKERDCRSACRCSIRQFGRWKKMQEKIFDPSLKFYLRMEGLLLCRQAQDAVLYYRLIRKHRERLFKKYMADLPNRTGVFRTAL